MRLLVKLQVIKNSPYERQYHYHLEGFIYKLLRGNSKYGVHNKQGNKFFCFSNIFPFDDLREDNLRNLIISSPNNDFISYLHERIDTKTRLKSVK